MPPVSNPPPPLNGRARARGAGLLAGIGAAGALMGLFYWSWRPADKPAAAPHDTSTDRPAVCARSQARVDALAPLARGAMAAAVLPKTPSALPPLAFLTEEGVPTTLAASDGAVRLVNLWATWCAPCREEMPTLNMLQTRAGGPQFSVMAINIDTSRFERARAFLAETAPALAFNADPKAETFSRLKAAGKAVGLPVTLLIGPDGCVLGSLAGAADWASDDAMALVRAAVDAP